ncbi:MAG: M14 family metallopeptidase [Pseudomonadota bacterium]
MPKKRRGRRGIRLRLEITRRISYRQRMNLQRLTSSARSRARLICLLTLATIAGCQTAPGPQYCDNGIILLDKNFSGGGYAECAVSDGGAFSVVVRPEDKPPINVSPWYAMRLSARSDATATIRIDVVDGYARYWPKISVDQRKWQRLDASKVQFSEDGNSLLIEVPVSTQGLYVSAQELVTEDWYTQWFDELRAQPDMTVALIGHSRLGRPLLAASLGDQPEIIVLLGRQHPPEITGALAMRHFVNTVLAETELARAFRERYQLLIVPFINPDGVNRGHWRHNTGSTDLNRDWGPFTQPETQSVRDLLAAKAKNGQEPALMFDFHSTRRNLFYTQTPEEFPPGEDVVGDWIAAAAARLPWLDYTREASTPSEQANSKNYFYKTYGITAVTYELGDEEDRARIEPASVVYAEEMMRRMLQRD